MCQYMPLTSSFIFLCIISIILWSDCVTCFKICFSIDIIIHYHHMAWPVSISCMRWTSTPMFDWGRLLTPSQKLWCYLDSDRWQKNSQMVVCCSGNSAKVDPEIQILGTWSIAQMRWKKCEKYLCVYMFVMLASSDQRSSLIEPAPVEKKTEMSSRLPKWFGSLLNRSVLDFNATTRVVHDSYGLLNILFRQCDPSSAFFGQLG